MNKKTAVFWIGLLVLALAASTLWAWNNYKRATAAENALAISHHHAFAELVTGMNELDTALQKSLYAQSPTVISAVCTDVFGKAMTAQMSLGSLPFSTQELEKTAAFISRVGDYAYSLSRSGESYTDEQSAALRELSGTATALAQNFRSLQQQLAEGGISMDELLMAEKLMDKAEEEVVGDTLGGGMRMIEEEFPEIPALIYDGPFSSHIEDSKPRSLEGQSLVSEQQAREAAAEFLAIDAAQLQSLGKSQSHVPCYYFAADGLSIEVTEQGGAVMNFLGSAQPVKAAMSANDAIAIAKKFLNERGYDSMSESYHMTDEGICTINFAYEQDGVVCYPDLVKVSVALDSGMVVGFEGSGYISSHSVRDIPAPEVSREEAQKQIGQLHPDSYRLAIIPTPGKHEKLCHEFVCSADSGSRYIIYVDAQTGDQEKILILLEDENGSLTI